MKDIVITVVNFFAWLGIIVATVVDYFAMKRRCGWLRRWMPGLWSVVCTLSNPPEYSDNPRHCS